MGRNLCKNTTHFHTHVWDFEFKGCARLKLKHGLLRLSNIRLWGSRWRWILWRRCQWRGKQRRRLQLCADGLRQRSHFQQCGSRLCGNFMDSRPNRASDRCSYIFADCQAERHSYSHSDCHPDGYPYCHSDSYSDCDSQRRTQQSTQLTP